MSRNRTGSLLLTLIVITGFAAPVVADQPDCSRYGLLGLEVGMTNREVWDAKGGKGLDRRIEETEAGPRSAASYKHEKEWVSVQYDGKVAIGREAEVAHLEMTIETGPDGDTLGALLDRYGEPTSSAADRSLTVWVDEACGVRVTAERHEGAWWEGAIVTVKLQIEPIPRAPEPEEPEEPPKLVVNLDEIEPARPPAEAVRDPVVKPAPRPVPERAATSSTPPAEVAADVTVQRTTPPVSLEYRAPSRAAAVSTQINPVAVADLSLRQSIVPEDPDVATEVRVKLTVTNEGPSDASDVQAVDRLGSGLRYVGNHGDGRYDDATGTWSVGALAAGEEATVEITAIVEPAGEYHGIAEITSARQKDPDSAPGNNVATEDDYAAFGIKPVPVSDLSLTHVARDVDVLVGDEVTLTVRLSNAGPSDSGTVIVTERLPKGLEYVRDDGEGTYSGRTGKWKVDGLPVGSEATLNVTARAAAAGDFEVVAEITDAAHRDPDSLPNNADAEEDDYAKRMLTPVALAELSLEQAVDNPTPDVGGIIVFTLTVKNLGPSDATGIVIADRLPSGYTYVRHKGPGAYDDETGEWTVGAVKVNESAELAITARVEATGEYDNVARIAACDQPAR